MDKEATEIQESGIRNQESGLTPAPCPLPPVRERPILFSGPMVRAILEGRKTQTRRVVKLPKAKRLEFRFDGACKDGGPSSPFKAGEYLHIPFRCLADGEKGWEEETTHREFCPYGAPGDRLWVSETFAQLGGDGECDPFDGWRPSIFMPRWASRLTLEIRRIRVERVQDISEADGIAEGVAPCKHDGFCTDQHTCSYKSLWDSLNAARGFGWDKNPWVWVIEFKRL